MAAVSPQEGRTSRFVGVKQPWRQSWQTSRATNVLLLAHGANDDKSTVGFTIANAALSSGMDVAIFLTSDAVELSRDGSCDFSHVKPFKKLEELIDLFVENGGLLWSCSPCFQHRGLNDKETVNKTVITGAGPLLEWVQAGAATLSI